MKGESSKLKGEKFTAPMNEAGRVFAISSNTVPIVNADSGLFQYLVDKALMNIFTSMRVGYADFLRTFYHKLMFPAGKWALKS